MPSFFIDRPIFAWVVALLITLSGTIAIFKLPISAYPAIAPPQISVSAAYPGASADVLEKTVTSVIEQQMTGIDNLLYFQSTSRSNGTVQITLTFDNGTDPDIAAVQVQNKVSVAEPRLPQAVKDNGVTVTKSNSDFLMVVVLKSSNKDLDSNYLNNLIAAQIIDPIQRLSGVGSATQFGSEYAMRIWLDPNKLRGYGLSAAQVQSAVESQNVQFAAGSIGADPAPPGQGITATVTADGRFTSPDQFRNIILRTNSDGSTVRLKDVARVELAAASFGKEARLDGDPIAGFAVQLAPGANALQTAQAVRDKMDQLQQYLPDGVSWMSPYDTTQFIKISIEEVVITLAIAFILVFVVILLFLENLRATLIPTLVIPVALTGAFAGMYIIGFSINILTLFALVLAIGLVVDDAIVVVENCERIMTEENLPPKEAARKAMKQISGAVVAITIVLAAVFIPIALVGGAVGVIYRQFALTIAISMLISATMALSFTPALCGSILKPTHGPGNWFSRAFNRNYERLSRGYMGAIRRMVRKTPRWMVVYGLLVALCGFMFTKLPSGFVPDEDQGYALAIVQLPAGATIERTKDVLSQMETILHKNSAVHQVVDVAGFSFVGQGENVGIGFIRLKPWGERSKPAEQIGPFLGWANGALQSIKGARIFVVNLPAIRGLGQFRRLRLPTGGPCRPRPRCAGPGPQQAPGRRCQGSAASGCASQPTGGCS